MKLVAVLQGHEAEVTQVKRCFIVDQMAQITPTVDYRVGGSFC
jgi:hypothetical protein